jgi:hypothetical protein
MLYQSFTNANVVPQTGAPVLYMQGLTAYAPPDARGRWQPLVDSLFCFRDLRFPRDAASAWDSVDIAINENERVSLYASILQSNPASRPGAVFPAETPGPPPLGSVIDPPEEAFIKNFSFSNSQETVFGPIYWNVFGALMFEDEI